jgi:hypothetical protein
MIAVQKHIKNQDCKPYENIFAIKCNPGMAMFYP